MQIKKNRVFEEKSIYKTKDPQKNLKQRTSSEISLQPSEIITSLQQFQHFILKIQNFNYYTQKKKTQKSCSIISSDFWEISQTVTKTSFQMSGKSSFAVKEKRKKRKHENKKEMN